MEEILKENLKEFFSDDNNEKVIFIGAGLSKNLGLPSWEEFGNIHLDFLRDNSNKINFEIAELLKKDDFRTVMSMTKEIIFDDDELKAKLFEKYKEIFKIKGSDKEGIVKDKGSIFSNVYDLGLINVTTNYDDILDILANENKQEFSNEKDIVIKNNFQRVFYKEREFAKIAEREQNINIGDVYHIHGSINDMFNMIISNEDYIERYWTGENYFKKFLKLIFDEYDVIFLGYGLKEFEILNYLFEKKKGVLQRTDKKRLFILDCFDYEKEKIKLLQDYYYRNYSIKLCPYSKSKKGFNALGDVVDSINKIKEEEKMEKMKKYRAIELLQKEELKEAEIYELLNNIKNYQDLQSTFLKKIRGEFQYLKYISITGYFKWKDINVVALMDYLCSIYDNRDNIDDGIIESLYELANKDLSTYRVKYSFISFIFKYSYNISSFNLRSLIEKDKEESFEITLIKYLLQQINEEYTFKFLKENDVVLIDLLCRNILKDNIILYRLSTDTELLKYLMENNNDNFVNKFIKNYENIYLKHKYENENFKLIVDKGILNIESKNKVYKNLRVKFDSLDNVYNEINKTLGENSTEIKEAVVTLLNDNSYSSIFDQRDLLNNKKENFLEQLLVFDNKRDEIIERLFTSKVYYLKKLALYFIVKNKMLDFIIKKINLRDFNFDYMIRNDEFAGEIKEIFKLLNNSERNNEVDCKSLLESIQKGRYFEDINESEEEQNRWQYKRLKELQNFECIKLEFEKLEEKDKHNYELAPLVGKCEGGWVKTIPMVDKVAANKYDVYTWVEWMNNYKEKNHKEFLIEYDIREDIKIFIKVLRMNIDSYMRDFKILINIKDYQWLYYIFYEINEILKSEHNIFEYYYENIFKFIDNYLVELSDIYAKPDKYSVRKKDLVSKLCEVLTTILEIEHFEVLKFKDIYKRLIEKLEELISDKDDFNKKSYTYTSFINSIHKDLLELEVIFLVKLDKLELMHDDKKYIKDIILKREERAPKEFYIFLGEHLSTFNMLDEEITKNFIQNMNEKNKLMFLNGFSRSRIINEDQYTLVKPIITYMQKNKLDEEHVISRLLEYYILAYLLGYKDSDIDLLKVKHNLTRDSILRIFRLKENYKSLVDEYNEKKFIEKIKEIWNEILKLEWEQKEKEVIGATIEAIENFDFIDNDIVKNIKIVIKFVDGDSVVNYKLCNYLKRILSEKTLEQVIMCIDYYKTDYWDDKIIELCKVVKSISEVKFREFSKRWLYKNKEDSELRNYLFSIKE